MKKIMTALALCFFAEVAWCGDGAQWVPGEIIIQIKSAKVDLPRIGKSFNLASLDDLGAKNGLMEYRRILPKADPRLPNISRMFLLKFPEEADVPGLCRQYALDPIVEHAEPNYLGGLCGTPNDAYWPLQWGMFGDRLNLPAAWDLAYPTSPSPDGIVIAVMDNGIDTLHPDLRPALWLNENEIPDNEWDDDDNGYVDDMRGWSFLPYPNYNNNVYPRAPVDGGHGTSCAGIAAAATNNGMGVAGVAGGWGISGGARLMTLRTFIKWDTDCGQFIESIGYAALNGARILSMSIHFPVNNTTLPLVQNAINDSYNYGCILVAASGNGGESSIVYPAKCDNVIAVGASIQADTAWGSSNYGPELSVMAPSGDNPSIGFPNGNIFTTTLISAGSYAYFSGTSAACPHVAGLAALILEANNSLTNSQVERIIKWTADTVDHDRFPYGEDNWNLRYGYGRINAYNAVQAALATPPVPGSTGNIKISTYKNTAGQCSLRVMWDYLPGTNGYRLYYGNAPGAYSANKCHRVETSNFAYLTNPPNPLFASVKAFNYLGHEGGFSPEISFNLPQSEWWYVEKYGDHQNAGVDLFYTSGNGTVLVLDVKAPYGSQWINGPVLRRDIPDMAITPDIDLNASWRQLDRDHALCLWMLVKGQDNIDRWLIYAANAANHWGETGTSSGITYKYVHMGDPSELYGEEEQIQRNISLDYYFTYGIKAALAEELRLSHYSFTGWGVGDHGGYIKDFVLSHQDWFPVTVQNQLIDRENYTGAGTVYCVNNWYQSPYQLVSRTYLGDQLFIEATPFIQYPEGGRNYFIYWNDHGDLRHCMGVPIRDVYAAYYKKGPAIFGQTVQGVSQLSWNWGVIPSDIPSYYFKLFNLTWVPSEGEPGGGYLYWRNIYTGTSFSYNHVLGQNDTRYFKVYVYCSGQGMVSNTIYANDPVPGDPIVAVVQDPEATAYSNGRKIAIDDNGTLHVTYTSGDSIYYTTSTDQGETWSPAQLVAFGQNPALALKAVGTPLLCWNQGSNVFTSERSSNSWGEAQLVYAGSPGEDISYLSFVADPNSGKTYSGWVGTQGGHSQVLVAERTPGNPIQPAPERIDFGEVAFKSPCLTLKKDGTLLNAWSRDGVVRFREGDGSIMELSQPGRHCIHPMVEAYGDRVTVVWQEAEGAKGLEPGKYHIVSRTRTSYGWSEERVIAQRDEGDYQYPVAAAAGQYLYAGHHGDGNYDIHYLGDYADGWETHTRNISINSEGQSGYPCAAFSNKWPNHSLYILWTEAFPESAKSKVIIPPVVKVVHELLSEPVPSFEVYPRTSQTSTYCTQRAGGLCYGAGAYRTVDYHPTELVYRFSDLNKNNRYKIKAVFYRFTGGPTNPSGNWIMQPRCDQVSFGNVHLPDTTVVTLEREIPRQCLNDGAVEITIRKIKGDYAVCAALEIIEFTTGGKGYVGGIQSAESGPMPTSYRYELMHCAPNPFKQTTTINYQIAEPGRVSLKVYNTLGQLVRTLEDGERPAGSHSVRWDGRDGNGHQVSNGVYLYRLEAGEFGKTRKMTLVR